MDGPCHFAVLFPDRCDLACGIVRLIQARYPSAPTDRIMTKTTYLDDPEGNGIELCCELPEDGELVVDGQRFYARRADGALLRACQRLASNSFKETHPWNWASTPLASARSRPRQVS